MGHITAAVDLGKTSCRVVVDRAGERTRRTGVGSAGLATAGGVGAAAAAILPLLDQAGPVDLIGVGAAGAWTAPDAAQELARILSDRSGARVAVTSDVVTAHVGALGGSAGTLLIAGTGAVALGIDADSVRLVDGWGPHLGDLGGGSWIGREGARAVLRSRDGLGPDTALTEVVAAHIAPATDVVSWSSSDDSAARRLASIAPLVLRAARDDDAVARAIRTEAVRLLAASAVAASAPADEIALRGGLTEDERFRDLLEADLVAAGLTVVHSLGDAVDGAALVAHRTDLPHERFVHRAR